MQTDSIAACLVENNDHIAIAGTHVGYVYSIEDADDDQITLNVCDEEGEFSHYTFAPFDAVNVIVSFEDDEYASDKLESLMSDVPIWD